MNINLNLLLGLTNIVTPEQGETFAENVTVAENSQYCFILNNCIVTGTLASKIENFEEMLEKKQSIPFLKYNISAYELFLKRKTPEEIREKAKENFETIFLENVQILFNNSSVVKTDFFIINQESINGILVVSKDMDITHLHLQQS